MNSGLGLTITTENDVYRLLTIDAPKNEGIMDIASLFDETKITKNNTVEDNDSFMIKEVKESVSIFNKTAYIFCEKKSFRSDAFCTLMSREYNSKLIYVSEKDIPELADPLCFIVDVTPYLFNDRLAQRFIFYIQDIASEKGTPIFLIGDEEDLNEIRRFSNHDDLYITRFKRPIDTKECIQEISATLLTSTKKKKRKHAMIVDDSQTFCKLFRKLLESKFRITAVGSALEGIKTLSVMLPKTPDIIIVDNKMPVCDGIKMIEMLKSDPVFENIPMIICSATSETDDLIHAMPLIDGYVLKSKPLAGLGVFLDEVIEKKKREKRSIEKL